ncbi:CmcI family methyltransferase [Rhodopila sp.]|uniref:CmcI family methyltransferase n=1 Tax=Rhodopila sp. TaxID=2480087 RepID=UPI003D110A9A
MPNLSIISHFYNQPHLVQEQIAYWETLPDAILSQVEFILIDDCSEQPLLYGPTRIDLKVFRIVTQIAWNQPGARNLGSFHARAEWALFFDIDQRFYSEPLDAILKNLAHMDPMTMYNLRSKKSRLGDQDWSDRPNSASDLCFHLNTFLVNLPAFKLHGMYDEDFSGHYGYDDTYMLNVWAKQGGKRVLYNDHEYFNEVGIGTAGLDRDLGYNLSLAENKVRAGLHNSSGVLRFAWEPVQLVTERQTPLADAHRDPNPTCRDLMRRLQGTDIYAGFVPTFAEDRQGWNSQHPAFDCIVAEVRPSVIIDVGVWKGGSTIYLAEALERHAVKGTVIAVDTFLGSLEHTDMASDLVDLIPRRHGTPLLYEQFITNVVRCGVSDRVVPLRQTSTLAAKLLQRIGVQAGLIHIDASHEYDDVLKDARAYWNILAPGGYLVGDDYHPVWPGVMQAADEFSAEVGVSLSIQTPKWIIQKPR